MPAKKKTENTSETTAIKTPRKRATKKAIEAEATINNDSVEVKEINEVSEVSEVSEVNEVNEVDEVDENKLLEITSNCVIDAKEGNESANLEVVDTTTDNNQINASNEYNAQEATSNKKQRQEGIYVQRKFYERVMGEKLEVTVQLEKLKITGIITYEHPFYILVETKQGQQFIYKQSISYISAKKPFIKRPFIKRDRPFINNRENTDNQVATGQEEPDSQPRFTKTPKENQNINQSETSQQPSEQPMRRPNEPKPLNRYQNQPPKNQSPKNQPQKDAREVKVYKIVCAPPVKPKK